MHKEVKAMPEPLLKVEDDYEYLIRFLPENWQVKAKEFGALRRCRKIPNAEVLLRVLLIHLAEGCSLRETAVRARQGGLVELSDVAIMDRLKGAGDWFLWMNRELMMKWITRQPATVFGSDRRVRLVDGTRITEPGPTGSSWCIHYAIELPSLRCEELEVCDSHGSGESFKRFSVTPGDLFVGDRAYGARPGIYHVVDGGGDVLVRFPITNLPMCDVRGHGFNLLSHLRKLRGTQVGQWPVIVPWNDRKLPGRVCAIKKSRQATEKALQHVHRKSQKNGTQTTPEAEEAAGYIFVFTTVDQKKLTASAALEMYRGRWQIELVFKRLKSILDLGHLHKTDERGAKAWIQGKLFVALLIETLLRHAESFFPWGYPLYEVPTSKPVSLA
jgi:hypothetical protein